MLNDRMYENFNQKLHFLRRTPSIVMAWALFAALVALLGWALIFANLREARTAVWQRALLEARALANTHAERLLRTVDALDQVALHVRADWQLTNGKLNPEALKASGTFTHAPYYVTLVNRYGLAFNSSLNGFTPVFLGDRSYFQMQKNAKEDLLWIFPPLLSRISGINVIDFSRRLVDNRGAFDGIVLVSVDTKYLTANYDKSILGTYGLIGFKSESKPFGLIKIGNGFLGSEKEVLKSPLKLDSTSGSIYLNGPEWFKDGRGRFIGWSKIPNYRLTAIVGLDEADTLSQYRKGKDSAIRYAEWATVALFLLTFTAIVLNTEFAWRKHQLDLTQTTYRLATEEGSEGFYIAQPIRDAVGKLRDFLVTDCNQSGAQFFGLGQQQIIGTNISSLFDNYQLSGFISHLIKGFHDGGHDEEVEIPSGSPFKAKWVQIKIIRSDDSLAVRLRDITETKAHVEELERRGNEDVLTSLPNRKWIQSYLPDAIQRAKSQGKSLALLFIDLDGFKKVNDTAGHAAGDELLQHAAARLIDAIRPHDKVVRFGGDEFVVILERFEQRMDAAHVAERVQRAFNQPFRLAQGVHTVGTSIGISLYPTDGENAPALLEKADIAMYAVKTSGKHGYQFYEEKFYNALRARLEKEAEIREAIARDQFIMYYQPRIEVSSGKTTSLEALVRWNHPSNGLLEPIEFIALAEETDLIVGIGEMVIEKVCVQLAEWSKSDKNLVPVSVNVSPRHFRRVNVADLVIAALARHGVAPELLELEITESSVMEGDEISGTLSALQRKGIKILVDDFGTGYSSLSQLHRLDFDILKVDKTFTSAIDKSNEGRVFFTAIVTMAHALGMRVVAEGVETLAQIEVLKSLQCDELQGFYISLPLAPKVEQPTQPSQFMPKTAPPHQS